MPDRADNNLERKERKKVFASIFTFILAGLVFIAVILTGIYFDRESTFQKDIEAAAKAAADREIGEQLLAAYNADQRDQLKGHFAKLREAKPAARDLRHLLMVTASELGENEFAGELKSELAPEDGKVGYGQSHFFAGTQIPTTKANRNVTPKEMSRMIAHFQIAAIDKIVPKEKHRWLGDCYFAINDFGNAVIEYRKLEEPSALVQYKLALSLSKTPNRGQAEEEMQKAIAGFEERLDQNQDDIGALIYLSRAFFHLGLAKESEEKLTRRLSVEENGKIKNLVRFELIRVYVSRLLQIRNRIEQKFLLERICQLDPGMRIHPLSREVFFKLGNILVAEKRYEEAKAHYRISTMGIKFPASVKNNMAWIEMKSQNGDLDSALKLSDEAIAESKSPSPEFIGTRGQILARLGRWEEAKKALESIVETVGDQKQVLLALAVVYSRLNEKEKAAQVFKEISAGEKTLEDYSADYPE